MTLDSPFHLVDLDREAPVRADARDRVLIGVAAQPIDAGAEFDVLLTGAGDPRGRGWGARTRTPPPIASRRSWRHSPRPPSRWCRCSAWAAGSPARAAGAGIPRLLDAAERRGLPRMAGLGASAHSASRRRARTAPSRRRPADVTFDRPWVRNAFDAGTRDALCEALHVAVADPSIAHVDLYGNGAAFCSGGDLAEFGTSRDPAQAHLLRVRRSPAALLQECGPRVTAHLHGACVGAGIELAAFAGRVLAAPDTMIRLPEIGMGLIPGAGGTASLPVRIGRERTAYLALSSGTLSAKEALDWGLVDELTAPVVAAADAPSSSAASTTGRR